MNFCVQVKNYPCVVNIIMRLIPWECPCGSETVRNTHCQVTLQIQEDLCCLQNSITFLFSLLSTGRPSNMCKLLLPECSLLLYRQESTLAIVVFPIQNNYNVPRAFGVLHSCENVGNFKKCTGSAWWPMASVVLTVRFRIMWPGVGWEPAPPLPALDGHWTAYLTPFLRLNPQTP